MTLHPEITFWASIVALVLTMLVLGVNVFYVLKFKQSVDIQGKGVQGTLLVTINNQFFYSEPHKKIIRCLERGNNLRAKGRDISDEDLDDHIGMLDTIGTFVRAKILEEGLVYELFSHYIESAYQSPEVAEYLKDCQRRDPSLFRDFVWIYGRMEQRRK